MLAPTSRSARAGVPLVAVVAVAFSVAGCGAAGEEPARNTATAPTVVTTSSPRTSEPTTPTPEKATVPNVIGMNHQQAQDTLQAAGFYVLREQDATGKGRQLVWDRNWQVVSQSVQGGASASLDTAITLSSKKIGE